MVEWVGESLTRTAG